MKSATFYLSIVDPFWSIASQKSQISSKLDQKSRQITFEHASIYVLNYDWIETID